MSEQNIDNFAFRNRGIFPFPFYLICIFFGNWDPASFTGGFIVVTIGLLLRFWSVGYLGKSSRRTDTPDTDALIVSGPYQFTRNPIYIGNILIYLGFAVLSNVFLPYFPLFTLMFFIFFYSRLIRYEEKHLHEKFGKQYEEYQNKVNRWLFTANSKAPIKHSFNFRNGIISEKTTWIVFTIALTALMIRILFL